MVLHIPAWATSRGSDSRPQVIRGARPHRQSGWWQTRPKMASDPCFPARLTITIRRAILGTANRSTENTAEDCIRGVAVTRVGIIYMSLFTEQRKRGGITMRRREPESEGRCVEGVFMSRRREAKLLQSDRMSIYVKQSAWKCCSLQRSARAPNDAAYLFCPHRAASSISDISDSIGLSVMGESS